MDIVTVSLFGHREIEHAAVIESRLEKLLHELIGRKEYVEFLIGRDGDFDLMASSVIRRVTQKEASGNTHFTLVLPYMKAEYRDNTAGYLAYYDEVEICAESASSHPKPAIQIRNRTLVDRSDLVICCIQHRSGGAYMTIQYAKKQKKQIVNLADEL